MQILKKLLRRLPAPAPQAHDRGSPVLMLALEPRVMFDAAIAATVAEVAAAQPDAAAAPAAATPAHEVVFISPQVDDAATLAAALRPGVERVVLDDSRDGLRQIADWLAGHEGITAVHIVSHGREGSMALGNLWLDSAGVAAHAATLADIGHALAPGADLLLYGCNVGAGAQGAELLDRLAEATGADVAASDDATGSAAFGGDWVLEAQRGPITAETAFVSPALGSYVGLLSVSDQNFDSESQFISPNAITSRNAGTWTFSAASAVDMAVGDINDFPGLYLVGTGDKAFIWNSGHNTGLISNVTQFSFTATDGTDFDLNSLSLSGASYSDFGTYAQTMSVTISGWRDSVQVVSGETVDLRTSDSAGNITYTMGGTGSLDDGLGTVFFNGYGQLSFGSAFDSVDEIRLSFGGAVTAEIDNIDITPALVRPTVSVVVADTALSVGETSAVTFTFSEAVTGFTNADLTLPNGTLSSVSTSDGGITWTATFTPTGGVTDTSNVISVDMTGVASVATSNAGTGSTNSNNFTIDTQRPTASISLNDSALRIGDTATVTFTFSEAVTGFTNADLSIDNGTLSSVSSGDGGTTWTATFTPTSSITDANNVITLDNTGVTDAAGNAGSGTTDSGNYAIDTVRPTASIALDDSALSIGETATVTFTFSEAVTGFTNADLSVANGTLGSVSSSDGGITWTATFTPTASVTDATNVITLDNTGVADAAGNAGTSSATSGNYAVDTVRPTLASSMTISDTALRIGDTATVTFTFTEAVSGFTIADLDAPNGSLSSLSSSDGGITWTATLTPSASITAASNVITLDYTGIADAAGNAGTSTATSGNYAVDTARPTLASAITISDTALRIGDTATVTFTFTEAVSGFTTADLDAPSGALSNLTSSDGGITWTATLTPSASTTAASNVITLDYTGITDAAGNAGTSTATSGNYAVDTAQPTLASAITISDTALRIGDTATVTFTFTEAVSGFTIADLDAPNGSLSSLSSSDGGITWTATLAPSASATAASNVITLDYTGIADAAGNAGTSTDTSGNYAVDTARPTLASAITISDTALRIGDTATVTFTFTEAVSGFTTADLDAPSGALSNLTSSDGGITWTATLTPSASTTAASNVITLDYTGITDAAGNAGTSTDTSGNYAVDTVRPTLASAITISDTALRIGDTATVTFTFSEAVSGFTTADLNTPSGSLSNLTSSDGGITWTATLTPSASTTAASNVITLDYTGITDTAGNAGTSTATSGNYAVDTAQPTLASAITISDTALRIGDTATVTFTFTEAVSGFTLADLAATSGSLTSLSSSDGGVTWTATLTPSASTTDATNEITLDYTGITDSAGNAGTGSATSGNYAVDTARPTVGIVVADNLLSAGETSLVTFTFSEAVTGFTNADLNVANGTLSSVSSSDGGITWTATFTPAATTTAASNVITLDNTGVTDAAGNAGSGTTDSNSYAVATAGPSASIVVADTSLTAGETTLVTITFSEAVTGFDNSDLTVEGGTLGTVSSADGGTTWTATFTPTAGITDTSNVITLDNTGVINGNSDPGIGTSSSANYTIDTQRPTLASSITISDTALRIGDTATVTFTFTEAVSGFTTADLNAPSGALSNLTSSDGGITWTATFTPSASTTAASNVITLDYTGITDAAGNAGTSTATSGNYAVDTVRPTLASSITISDTALRDGDTATVTFTFAEAVSGFTLADLNAPSGLLSNLGSSDGGITWTATLTPNASTTAASNVITLDYTGITDAAGNAGTSTASSGNYAVDTVRPTATISVADPTLTAGETTTVTITFSEAVTGFTNADLTVANGTLGAVSSSDGGVTWTATFTPTSGVTDATNAITLDNTGVADAAGNAGTGTTTSGNYAIDAARPTVAITMADTALRAGETSLVTFTFSEAVTGFTNADLTVANGTLTAVSSSDGGITWTATFTPGASVTDATNVITLDNAGVADAAGNTGTGTTSTANYAIDTARPLASITMADTALAVGDTSLVTISFSEAVTGFTNADLTVANGTLSAVSSSDGGITWTATFTPTAGITDATNLITLNNTGVTDAAGNTGTGSANTANYSIDTLRPTAAITMSDTALAVGETAVVTFTFSEAVSGFTNADLSVASGTLSAVSSSDGGITWTATFTPAAGVTAAANLITLNNAGVADSAGNTATGTTSSPSYAVDTVRPMASIALADTTLTAGETTLVTITFSEAVSGFSNADLSVTGGTLGPVSSSDGGITWTALFTPGAGVTAPANLVTLTNAGVTDAAGNAGTGSTSSDSFIVDTVRPLSAIDVSDTDLAAGETAVVTITFSEAVTGFTNADLTVANGTLGAVSSSDGGVTWTATFTPTAGVQDLDNLITLDNTGVTDAAGNTGTGTTDSANIAIDTRLPSATITVADTALGVGESTAVTITFSEAVAGFSNADLTVANGTLSAVSSSDGGTTWTATFTPTSGVTQAVNVITLDNTGVADAAGNAGVGTTVSANIAIDGVAPTVAGIVQVDATPTGATAVRYTVSFSEAVTGVDAGDFTVVKDSTVSGSIASVTQVNAQTYTVLVSGISGSGQLGLQFNAGGSGVADAVGNAVGNSLAGTAYDVRSASPPTPAAPPAAAPPPDAAPSPAAPPAALVVLVPDPVSRTGTLNPISVLAPPPPPVFNIGTSPVSGGEFSPTPTVRSGVEAAATVSPRGGFIESGAPTVAGLRALPDVGDFTVQAGGTVNFGLPPSTFTHGDATARITVEARQSNGQPLPAWLRFDPATGSFTGRPPAGVSLQLGIEVIARDETGRQASSHLDITIQGAPAAPDRPAPQRPGQPPQRPPGAGLHLLPPDAAIEFEFELEAAEAVEAGLPQRGAAEADAPPGRPALGAQFARLGVPARQAQAAALLDHLRAAARQAA